MNTLEKINELVSLCKGSVHIEFNAHTTNYETLEEYLRDNRFSRFTELEPELVKEIIEKGVVVEIQAYPKTPVGFILRTHHDIDAALEQAIEDCREY